MFCLDLTTGKSRELKSQLRESYTEKIRENARRNEWKSTGSGAMFMGEASPMENPEAAVRNINSTIHAIFEYNDEVLYSMTLDSVSGIYSYTDSSDKDGIVISGNNVDYSHFDIKDRKIVLSEGSGLQNHIGILENGQNTCEILTEGESREKWPSWSKLDKNRLIYSGCGLAITRDGSNSSSRPFLGMMPDQNVTSCVEGPYSISAFDLSSMELYDLIEDKTQKYSYVKPTETDDGYIYYIKKPYGQNEKERVGCLSALLAPFRLIAAIFGFLNFFTMKYSGNTLTNGKGATKSKQRSEAQMFIDGNMINAEKEMERNQKSGDKFPGFIPRSYELCRRRGPNGDEEVIKKGVIAYAVDKHCNIFCSNGSHLLKLTPNGSKYDETMITKEKGISFISVGE